jgi:hypothetical protein
MFASKQIVSTLNWLGLGGFFSPENHWCRIVMNEDVRRLLKSLNIDSGKVLEISGNTWRNAGFKNYSSTSYPAYDICQRTLEERFELIIAEQVFEHLFWPYRAGRNVHTMLQTGGHFLISVPFLIRIHNAPDDCTRWTQTGLRYFLAECGFDLSNIVTGAWGNRACVRANLDRWMPYIPLIHSLANQSDVPMVVWAMARK